MKSKILYFLTAEFPYGKGETFIENEISYLADAFDKVIIIPLKKSSVEHRTIPHNILIEPLQARQISWFKVFSKIAKEPEIIREFLQNIFSNPLKNKILLKSMQNALTISGHLEVILEKYQPCENYLYSYWLDDGAISLAFLNKNSVKISRAHRWDIYTENQLYEYLPLRKYLAQRLSQIYSISQDGKEYLEKATRQPEKVHLSRLGVVAPSKLRKNILDKELNIISISYVIPRKRVELIGEAINLININKICWKHFGDGPLLNKVKNMFTFGTFYGHLGNNKLTQTLKMLPTNSVLINTSMSEGLPVSMMEAMSFGIPCLGTNVGGVSEIIEDGVNGFLMPPNPTAKEVSVYIQKYLDLSIDEKRQFRLNAFKTWQEKFDAEKNYQEFINQIKGLRFDNN